MGEAARAAEARKSLNREFRRCRDALACNKLSMNWGVKKNEGEPPMRLAQCFAAICMTSLILSAGCQSKHEEGVKSNLHTQWTDVSADTRVTTSAAEAVLRDQGLKDVKSQSTKVDGQATGIMADGTKVTVSVAKKGESASQVSVNVGKIGDPKLGAEIAQKIRTQATTSDTAQ